MEKCLYEDEEKISGHFRCELCSRPLVDPVTLSSSCGQTFCRSCLTEGLSNHIRQCSECSRFDDPTSIPWTRESPRFRRYLDDLRVRCSQCSSRSVFPRRLFVSHLRDECPKRLVFCSARDVRCSWQGFDEDLRFHRSRCPYEQLKPLLNKFFMAKEQLKRVMQMETTIVSLQEQTTTIEEQTQQLREETKIIERIPGEVKELFQRLVDEQTKKEREMTRSTKINEEQETRINELRRRNEERIKLEREMKFIQEDRQRTKEEIQTMKRDKERLNEERDRLRDERDFFREKSLRVDSMEDQLNQAKVKANAEEILRRGLVLHINRLKGQMSSSILPAEEEEMNIEEDQQRNQPLEELITRCGKHSLINLSGQTIGNDQQSMSILLQRGLRDGQCHTLLLSRNSLSSESIVRLANELNSNRTLEKLILSHNVLSLSSVESLCHPLSLTNVTLRQLTLSSVGLDDRAIPSICAMLKTNQSLLTLGLHENHFSDRAVELLAEVLQGENQNLQELSLHSHPLITDLSLPFLLSIFRFNQSLNIIDLQLCQFSPTAKEQLQQTVQYSKTDFHLRL